MKIVTWNVNGFRAVLKKGFEDFFNEADADIFCLQETKMQPDQADFHPQGYEEYFNSAQKKGYSGTGVFTKLTPLSITCGIEGFPDDEGRVQTLEFEEFYLVNCYVPNAQNELKRIDYRCEFEDHLREYLCILDRKKPVVYCGDLNVAHTEIDLKNPKTNRGNAGFSDQEREKMTALLSSGFTDVWRKRNPEAEGIYTWWSYRFQARKNNAGWRIDYFIVSDRFYDSILDCRILGDVEGSDHCPVMLELKIS